MDDRRFIADNVLFNKFAGIKLTHLLLYTIQNIKLGLITITARTWRGETDKGESFNLIEHNGVINIGLDEREFNAQFNVEKVGLFENYKDLTAQEILGTLGVSYEWEKYWEFI